MAEGAQDFVLFWRTLPWDHAPGALLVDEAGGLVAHLDGQGYRPGHPRTGLLAAADPGTHARVLGALGRDGTLHGAAPATGPAWPPAQSSSRTAASRARAAATPSGIVVR